MPDPIMTPLGYAMVYDEVTWGTTPVSPTYYAVPYFDYDVRFHPDTRQATPFIGVFQNKHNRNPMGMPKGPMRTALYGWQPPGTTFSLAEYLLTWAFGSPEEDNPASKGIEAAEGPDVANHQSKGLRVNSAILRGSAASKICSLDLDLMGKDDVNVATAQTLPTDHNTLVEMEYADCTFALGGVAINLDSFAVSIQNGLQPEYMNSSRPSLMPRGRALINVVMVPAKTANTYDAYERLSTSTELTGQIVVKGLHNGTGATGTQSVGTISFPRLSLVRSPNQDKGRIRFQALNFIALKPDSSSNAMSIAWSEA